MDKATVSSLLIIVEICCGTNDLRPFHEMLHEFVVGGTLIVGTWQFHKAGKAELPFAVSKSAAAYLAVSREEQILEVVNPFHAYNINPRNFRCR